MASKSTSSSKKGGYVVSETKAYLKSLGSDLERIRTNMTNLKNHIALIEKGNGKTAYWSGPAAKKHVINLKNHYNNSVKMYNKFLNVYNILYARVYSSSQRLSI